MTLSKNFSAFLSAVDIGLPISEVNASAATGSVTLQGMSTATKLTAGKGGSSLIGGAGNDTFVGGKGVDVFVSGDGNDLIDKYVAGDKVQIVGLLTKGEVSGSNVVLTASAGKVTVKGAVNKEMTLVVDGLNRNTNSQRKTPRWTRR